MKNISKLTIFYMLALLFSSCQRKTIPSGVEYSSRSLNGIPDYSKLAYWAAHPHKWDPSDSIPSDLRKSYVKDSLADVFFLYPTSLTSGDDNRWNADIDDSTINTKTDLSSILYQASAFSEKTRVFAPRYRQAHYRAFLTEDKRRADSAFAIAYSDIKNAFEFYITHENKGKPFIIAAHSQGTYHAARLIKEMIEGRPLQNQLVVAYLLGMPVSESYFKELQPCRDSSQTSCIISWRTYQRGYIEPMFVANEKFKAIVTNPLTWRTNEDHADIKLNRGAVLRKFNDVKPAVVDAQIHGNVLWTSKPKFFGNIFLRTKNYHIADINFFYADIADNVKLRIKSYLNKRKLQSN